MLGNVNHNFGHNAAMGRPETYTYRQLQDRIQQVLGVNVPRSTLRAAMARRGSRATAGMPLPFHATRHPDAFDPASFDVAEVESWLASHPKLRQDAALAAIASSPKGHDHRDVVANARGVGVSWERIAAALSLAEGRSYSKQAAHKRYAPSEAQNGRQEPRAGSPAG